jgi:hypothetical protein
VNESSKGVVIDAMGDEDAGSREQKGGDAEGRTRTPSGSPLIVFHPSVPCKSQTN